MLRGIRLEMFWDGAEKPAVSVPIGDFFCHGLGRMATFQNALFSSPEGRSFNCCVPMPFRNAMKVVVTNETSTDLPMFFYDIDYTVGDPHTKEMLYFHSHYRRENPTTMQRDFEFLPRVRGRGRFLGANVGVIADMETYDRFWWGEGEVKMYLDGDDEFPTLCGTGTEDYIGTGWGQGQYAQWYQGCQLADRPNMQFVFYRLHVPDPVYFHQDIRVTMQQIGCGGPGSARAFRKTGQTYYRNGPGRTPIDLEALGEDDGVGLYEREDDWSCCAWFYMDRPENGLPDLPPLEERTAGLLEPEEANKRMDT
jgi:hypothetical protein